MSLILFKFFLIIFKDNVINLHINMIVENYKQYRMKMRIPLPSNPTPVPRNNHWKYFIV